MDELILPSLGLGIHLCAGTGVAHAFWPLLLGYCASAPLQPLPGLLLC
jgi:hypothetical protein